MMFIRTLAFVNTILVDQRDLHFAVRSGNCRCVLFHVTCTLVETVNAIGSSWRSRAPLQSQDAHVKPGISQWPLSVRLFFASGSLRFQCD